MLDEALIPNHAGVDEVGRGPLAGDVVCAAVILNPDNIPPGLCDSKKLTAKRREILAEAIKSSALSWSVGRATIAEIDEKNILQATMLGMQRAVAGLSCVPSMVYIDGNRCPDLPYPAKAIIKGDALVAAISAASIIAKVTRDGEMIALDRKYPGYGFAQHKGYPTKAHIQAIRTLGVTPYHRQSFAPVREAILDAL